MNLPDGYRLDDLRPVHLPQIASLYADRGWILQAGKWDYLFGQHRLFGIFREDSLVATGGLHQSGDAPPVVIMIVVHSEHSGQGLGKFVTQEAIRRAQGVPCCLCATDMGRPLYEKLGFKVREHISVYRSIFDTQTKVSAQIKEGHREEFWGLDHRAYGVSRDSLLSSLWERRQSFWVGRDSGEIVGGALSFWEDDQLCVGPVYAKSPRLAQALIERVSEGHEVVLHLRNSDLYLSWLNRNQAVQCHFEPFMVEKGYQERADDSFLATLASFAYG